MNIKVSYTKLLFVKMNNPVQNNQGQPNPVQNNQGQNTNEIYPCFHKTIENNEVVYYAHVNKDICVKLTKNYLKNNFHIWGDMILMLERDNYRPTVFIKKIVKGCTFYGLCYNSNKDTVLVDFHWIKTMQQFLALVFEFELNMKKQRNEEMINNILNRDIGARNNAQGQQAQAQQQPMQQVQQQAQAQQQPMQQTPINRKRKIHDANEVDANVVKNILSLSNQEHNAEQLPKPTSTENNTHQLRHKRLRIRRILEDSETDDSDNSDEMK